MPKFNQINNKTPEQMKSLFYFAQNPFGFLLMAGTNGTGKSFAAEAIYEIHTPYKLPYYDKDLAYFVTQANLNAQWLDAKQEGSATEILNRLKECKLLVIDDLGTRTPTEAFLDFLYDLFDHRWRNRERLGTIITTNLNWEGMISKFGDAIASRICCNLCLRFDGEDRRQVNFI